VLEVTCLAGLDRFEDGTVVTLAPAIATDVDALPLVGRENYLIEGEFAQGGMGRILSAHDRRLGRTVALKELQADASPDARRMPARHIRGRHS